MSLDTNTDILKFDSRGKGETIQIMTEGEMIVPDINPDIYQILKTEEDVIIDRVRAEQGRINFAGRICCNVLYYGRKTQYPLSSMKSELTFDDYIMSEDITEESDVDVSAELVHTDYRMVNDRKISVRVVTAIKSVWNKKNTVYAVTDISGNNAVQCQYGSIGTGGIKERKTEEFNIHEELAIPSIKPDIIQILEVSAAIQRRDIRPNGNSLAVSGEIKINVLYISDSENNAAESAEFIVPFNGSAEIEGSENALYMPRLQIKKVSADIMADENGEPRIISVDIPVEITVKEFSHDDKNILEDAYSLSIPIEIQREDISYTDVVGKNMAQGVYRTVMTAEDSQPDIMQIVKAWCSLRGIKASCAEDKAQAEGIAEINVMYIAKDDERPLDVIETILPFNQEIEIKGLDENSQLDINAVAEDLSFSMLSEKEVEIRLTVSFDAVATDMKNGSIITAVTESENEQPCQLKGGAVIYTVKKGDTLWNIAKKYHTTVEDIVKINKIENPDLIYPCQRLLIFKKFV